MATDHRAELARIQRFDQLVRYLRAEMGWPIASDDFEELTFDYSAEELGINAENAAKIQEIKRLRPLSAKQPWGIFFVKFEPKSLPVVALRRVLSQVAIKKRASANAADRAGWEADDLLFVSNYGQGGERQISFAHFSRPSSRQDLPTLKVLGWDNRDTPLHLDAIARELTENLAWPIDGENVDEWRRRWRGAFTLGHREVITTAERLSIRLAELAGSIRDRIRSAIAIESPRGPLTRLMKAFQESLVQDLDAEGFADMYAQTISYGLLSSRIADPSKKTADDFALHMRTSPFLRELMQTFLRIGGRQGKADGAGIDFDELGVADVVELLDGANMEAVLQDFGDRNRQEDPVIHFFEGFLQAYDKKIRKDRGVFYTPQPVVSYIVRSVHELLRSEFGLEDGLADTTTWGEMLRKRPGLKLPLLTDLSQETQTISPNEPFVQILDPATGTATFLVEVIEVIHQTLTMKWKAQLLTESQQREAWNSYVPKHLLPRLHAYELMMAPYAIAHMKIGLKLAETGYRFGTEERARIYLTNALEPWLRQLPLIGFDALAHEAAAVNEIKGHKRFTVVLGNPPYSNFSANLAEEQRRIINRYKVIDGQPLRERNALQLERNLNDDYVKFLAISEDALSASNIGILGIITNNSYLGAKTLRGVRARLLEVFDHLSVLDLGGSTELSGSSAKRLQDENVFDIAQGVAVSIFCRTGVQSDRGTAIKHTRIFGDRESKYSFLASHQVNTNNSVKMPTASPLFLFGASPDSDDWANYLPAEEIFSVYAEGMKTGFDNGLVGFTEQEVRANLKSLASPKCTTEALREQFGIREKGWANDLINDRRRTAELAANSTAIVRFPYRPFDFRYVPWPSKLLKAPSSVAGQHLADGKSICLILAGQVAGPDYVSHFYVSRRIPNARTFYSKKGTASYFPLYRHANEGFAFDKTSCIQPSAGRQAAELLGMAWIDSEGGDLERSIGPESLLQYCYAIFHSPTYRRIYDASLKVSFPRLPLTGNSELFRALVELGGELIALHLLESSRLDKPLTDFTGARDTIVEKVSWVRDSVWLDKTQRTGFRGVSEPVWNFQVGGYQVCEKWLKDRQGRTLSNDDIAHYQKVVVALSETIRVMNEIDLVIEQHGGWPGAFQSTSD